MQRVGPASVDVDGERVGSIAAGLLVLLGVGANDGEPDCLWLAEKVANLRIFPDDEGRMNRSVLETGGSVLVVSQFTLYADARKGRRPSYSDAAEPALAERLYEGFMEALAEKGLHVEHGRFQAEMDVSLVNRGPVTVLLDSKKAF